ncbi:MAG: MotA/TolQ/ExbB proton channel family protein [Blautia sp.]|nr:MotA/TolQ/ExbB proton channel family protein [Blautia sp.]
MGRKVRDFFLFLLVLAAVVILTLVVSQGADRNVMIYNFVFLGVIVVLYLAGMFGGMFRMSTLAEAIGTATEELVGIFKTSGKVSEDKLKYLNGIFSNPYLDNKMDNFTQSLANSEESIGEIEEFLNEEELDNHIHKRLLELVPDILTSLGILGTFVGLVWGLKNFDPGNYETMTTSVSSLVGGIKVAFLTSIYGISFSVVYNYGIKSSYSVMTENLQAFLERFHAYVIPTAENESRNLLVATQKRQSEAMGQMAEQFSSQMALSFEKVITPTFQKMNNSLDMLVASVTQNQEEAMQALLDEFLREMNASFKIQFRDFNEALADLKRAQKDNAQFTRDLYHGLSQELTDAYTQQERLMRSNLSEITKVSNQYVASANRILSENTEKQKEITVEYQHIMDYLKESERSSAKFWVACNQAMQKYVESAASTVERIGTAGKSSEELARTNQRVVEELNLQVQKFNDYQKMSFETMEEVRRLLADITVAKENNDVVLKGGGSSMDVRRMESVMREQGERQQELMEEMNRTMSELSKTAQKGKRGLFR